MKQPSIQTHTVSRETFSATDRRLDDFRPALSDYIDQLIWWNQRVNLVSRGVPRGTIWEHIRHSLLLSQFSDFQSENLIVDAGTGGGLPGIPLAITHPDKIFILNDIVSKKCLAVKQIIQKLGLENTRISDGSIENIDLSSTFLLVSKHAFKINELYELTAPLPWQKMVFYKGRNFEDELENIDPGIEITAYNLFPESDDSFYKDKAIVFVNR